MRQMLDRGHAQVKQFSGLAAEPACKHDEHGDSVRTGDSGQPGEGCASKGLSCGLLAKPMLPEVRTRVITRPLSDLIVKIHLR